MKQWLKPILFIMVLITTVILAGTFELDQKLSEFNIWVQEQGIMGPLVFIGVYTLATVFFIPGSALTIMAGAVFGSVTGVLAVITGATLGASLCFLISRYFARDSITSLLQRNDKFKKFDDLTEKNGAIIVAITRLVPLFPFNLLNYAFGLTKIPFWTYVIWSAVCMLPGTILYVAGTDAIATAIRDGQIPWDLVVVVVTILGLLTWLARKANRRLKE